MLAMMPSIERDMTRNGVWNEIDANAIAHRRITCEHSLLSSVISTGDARQSSCRNVSNKWNFLFKILQAAGDKAILILMPSITYTQAFEGMMLYNKFILKSVSCRNKPISNRNYISSSSTSRHEWYISYPQAAPIFHFERDGGCFICEGRDWLW